MERRTFLALGVTALGLAGCTGDRPSDAEGGSQPPRPPARDPDAGLRVRVAASETALIAEYRAALVAFPGLAPELEPFLAHHEAHLARVAPDLAGTGAAPGSPVPSARGGSSAEGDPASPPASAAADAPGADPTAQRSADATAEASTTPSAEASTPLTGPDSAPATLERLAEAEAAALRDRVAACDGATNSVLARDLCLIAASEAQHQAELAALLDGRRPG